MKFHGFREAPDPAATPPRRPDIDGFIATLRRQPAPRIPVAELGVHPTIKAAFLGHPVSVRCIATNLDARQIDELEVMLEDARERWGPEPDRIALAADGATLPV